MMFPEVGSVRIAVSELVICDPTGCVVSEV